MLRQICWLKNTDAKKILRNGVTYWLKNAEAWLKQAKATTTKVKVQVWGVLEHYSDSNTEIWHVLEQYSDSNTG